MRKIKRFFTKRRVMILSLCLVVFVMSLGYAALSQYIELDGIASIDRSWIVKITNVTNTVTNSATSISSTYVSNTVTLNSNLPTSDSSITYTITLSNQGNIPAKLNNIDVIEDENTNITYEISGVTNIGDTEKSIMLTFNYIENSGTIGGDSGFYGDRSLSGGLGYGTNNSYYRAYNRLEDNKIPQFSCPQSNDLYTTSSSSKGNKALDYPIGLITADEVAYAGGVYNQNNTSYYLYIDVFYWTMTPHTMLYEIADVWCNDHWNRLNKSNVGYNVGWIRPVINLKSDVRISSGDGTSSNPYEIFME